MVRLAGLVLLAALVLVECSADVHASPKFSDPVSSDERGAIAQIKSMLVAQVMAHYHEIGHAERDAHAKAQGCVKARFEVSKSVPDQLRSGIFEHPKTYIAWIRFSNAVGTDDHAGLARGMAIKLTGVPGQKILPNEAGESTQDFLLVNYPVFNVRTDAEYVDFLRDSQSGQLAAFLREHPRAARITQAIAAQRVYNPLRERYFSMTPYALGPQAVKYSAQPVSCSDGLPLPRGSGPIPADPDYLRKAMTAMLASGGSCFVFMVQQQTDPRTMPIEDSTVRWSSPFVRVASISIPKQRFDSAAQQTFCDNLSYTPWHSLPQDRPLGNINRIRRVVYDAISTLRHRLNGVARREPTGHEHFEGTPQW